MYINKEKEANRYMVDVFSSPSISIRLLINETVECDANKIHLLSLFYVDIVI
jgi:hypothetical protein